MDIPKSVFMNSKSRIGSSLPTMESFENEEMDYMIPEVISGIMEESFSVIREHMTATYFSIKYDNDKILEEGFKEFKERASAFFEKVKNIFTNTIGPIFTKMQSYLLDFGKFIDHNKESLNKFNKTFTIGGYEFNLINNSPNRQVFEDFINDFNNMIGDNKNITSEYVEQKRIEFSKKEYKDKLRASILNDNDKKELNSGDTFITEVDKTYRGGTIDTKSITVNQTVISQIVSNYSEMKSQLDKLFKDRDEMLKILKKTKYFFDKHVIIDKSNGYSQIATNKLNTSGKNIKSDRIDISHDSSTLSVLNNYYDLQFEKASLLYTCYLNVYFKKINALKDYLKQSRNIIRKALTMINKSKEGETNG